MCKPLSDITRTCHLPPISNVLIFPYAQSPLNFPPWTQSGVSSVLRGNFKAAPTPYFTLLPKIGTLLTKEKKNFEILPKPRLHVCSGGIEFR